MQYLQFHFNDSLNFLSTSFGDVSSVTHSKFPDNTQFDLAQRKGMFPYDCLLSMESLNCTSLPPKDTFHNAMKDEGISDANYSHSHSAWNAFHCKNLLEYAFQYLCVNFMTICFAEYGLDPVMYITAPSLTWAALLLKTGVRLELLTDIVMFLFMESMVRGGITQVSNSYVYVNNICIGDKYDPYVADKYICYFDIDGLYSHTMNCKLAIGSF
ncbi:hypothetical protein PR048_002421, partial [Dryococelus australis]